MYLRNTRGLVFRKSINTNGIHKGKRIFEVLGFVAEPDQPSDSGCSQ
jgi:hypothetical protein